MGGAQLIEADVRKGSFESANLEEADFSGARLKEANLLNRTMLKPALFEELSWGNVECYKKMVIFK